MPGEQDSQGAALHSRKKGKNSVYEVKLIYYKYIRVYFHFFIHKAYKNAGFMLMKNI